MNPGDIEALADRIRAAQSALFITGAGISADSGLPTYRGIGGLYDGGGTDEGVPIEVALSGAMLRARPDLTWKYIHQIEAACRGAQPNAAHRVLAGLEDHIPRLWILTQNVDGFHRAAGSSRVIEIHGNLGGLTCTACRYRETVVDYAELEIPPSCPACGALVRPDVVLFGEMLPAGAVRTLGEQVAIGFDLVVAIGTSSAFPYIADPVLRARQRGAATVEINPERTILSGLVDLHIQARARPVFEALWSSLT